MLLGLEPAWFPAILITATSIWFAARFFRRADGHRRDADSLRVREQRTRRILETANDAVISTDGEGRITSWNASAQRMFGWTRAEALGLDGPATLFPDGLGDRQPSDFVADGNPALETVARHRDGQDVQVEISVSTVREPEGWVFHAFLRDVTERRLAHERLEATQHEVLQRLAIAAEYRDDATGEHTRRVGDLSAQIAKAIGSDDGDVDLIRRAAPLHDVGKVGIPDALLLKPARLTGDEFEVVKLHAEMGAEMLAGRGFPLLETAEWIARSHHERWDGSGYPAGLCGEEIPQVGRIVALADVYDALTHARPYKPAWTHTDALAQIRTERGRHFDPTLVDAFLEVIARPKRSRFVAGGGGSRGAG